MQQNRSRQVVIVVGFILAIIVGGIIYSSKRISSRGTFALPSSQNIPLESVTTPAKYERGYHVVGTKVLFVDNYNNQQTVQGADAATFKSLYSYDAGGSFTYGQDGTIIDRQPFGIPPYAVDKNNAYCDGIALRGSDPVSFMLLDARWSKISGDWDERWAKDSTHVWLNCTIVPNANPGTFSVPFSSSTSD